MSVDPDVILAKPRSTVLRWMQYSAADAMVDEWQQSSAEAALAANLERQQVH